MKKNLTFNQLAKANKKRDKACLNSIETWSETDIACALAGEVGELCNYVKKRRRVDYKDDRLIKDIGKELGDIVSYCDTLAQRYGLDLGTLTKDKFNEISKRWKVTEFKL